MSSPGEYYASLPPVSKAYGTICLLTTTLFHFGLVNPYYIALIYSEVLQRFQIWRLVTNFFFLGKFSINFGIRLLMIARYGVQLEQGPFARRTADFLWMMIFGSCCLLAFSIVPQTRSYFLAVSLVFMLLYVWSREYPNAQINIYGLVTIKAFYLPWTMLALDVIFGSPLVPDLLGIVAGHLYYFLTVLHPLAGGRNMMKTPAWVYPCFILFEYHMTSGLIIVSIVHSNVALRPEVIDQGTGIYSEVEHGTTQSQTSTSHKLVARWGIGAPAASPVQASQSSGTTAFRGRSYRLAG